MSEPMTPEQVRDWHRREAANFRRGFIAQAAAFHERAADAIDAHCALVDALGDRAGVVGELHRLALAIADDYARSDIEFFCARELDGWYDTTQCEEPDLAPVDRALRYIELRGDVMPYSIERDGAKMRLGVKA